MKREEILATYEAGPEAVIKLVNTLTATIFEQSEQITALQERVKDLEVSLSPLSRQKYGLYLVHSQAVCFVCWSKGFLK